ncbi:MAG TPA: MBL fold metallo-hydrolase [Vicinamibacterales bacterium]
MVRRVFAFVAIVAFTMIVPAFAGDLEIHVIDVGMGCSVLVHGPNGTTVLMDAGDKGKGAKIVQYLESIGIRPQDGLDYTIVGHLHDDHIGGFDEVVGKGPGKYDVHIQNYYNGSSAKGKAVDEWRAAAKSTTAKHAVVLPVGASIPLGDGATLTCIARNGTVIGGKKVAVKNENDRSIAVVVQYHGFDYYWASDLGGGKTDAKCTGRNKAHSQTDVESSVIQAILPNGAHPLISKGGIDVLHVSHHGSETSTNVNLLNGAAPAVAIISTGDGQDPDFQFPRKVVVDKVLGAKVPCVTVPAPLVLQTEEGKPRGTMTSTNGFSVGNIVVRTDGKKTFTIEADGKVSEGPNEVAAARLPRTFDIVEVREP